MPVPKRLRQNLGLVIGISLGGVALIVLLLPDQEALHARGPMTRGHEEIRCENCHRPARGTLRQQIQANARHLIGLRESPADFGLSPAGNRECLACHERPNERHPVFRFNEPRFREARSALHPESCISCHLEHRGVLVTIEDTDYCRHCHEDTRLKKDPVDVSHETLIETEQWDSCLGCHDFHGNHEMELAQSLQDAIEPERIRDYFNGSRSPYAEERKYAARREPAP